VDARQRVLDLASGDAALGLTLLAGPVCANTLGNGWHLDDYYRVLDNPGIQSVGPVGRHVIDPTTSASLDRIRQYRPLLLEEAPRRSRLERTMSSDRGRKVVGHEPLRYAGEEAPSSFKAFDRRLQRQPRGQPDERMPAVHQYEPAQAIR
jgi:hypothetical protein